ncbi:MAG TPA: formyltransferase family protein [Candidatus Sulfotelmatobacter sp.]|nr:formyltransferase family protein [Candidatus Sulfotelmatobacter sp.]
MKITIFTSNQPRHLALVTTLASYAEEVYSIHECTTARPGQVADFFRKSEVMRDYFQQVMAAERAVFGRGGFCPPNVRQLAIRMGDLNLLDLHDLGPALESDVFVIFGGSYIKGALADFLVQHRAYNIHMGVSPFYRGSSTNFWALYDGRPQYVGATIHLLTAGLDSGPMLFHALPPVGATDPFLLGMLAVRAAHQGLVQALVDGTLPTMTAVAQDKHLELRYTRSADFTDEIATEYLRCRLPSAEMVKRFLQERAMSDFVRPFIGN